MRRRRQIVRLVSLVGLCAGMLLAARAAYGHDEFLPPMPPPARPAGPTLATVNGAPVTLRDYEDAAKSLPRERRSREDILQKAIQLELLRQEGIRLGFDKDPTLIKLLDQLRREYLKDQLVQREAERLRNVPDTELRRYYDAREKESATTRRPFEEIKGTIREEFIRDGVRKRFEALYAEAERQGLITYDEAAITKLMVPAPDNPKPDAVLATVNGTVITVHDFGHVFFLLDRAGKEATRADPKPLVRGLVLGELRRQEGLRLGLDRDAAFAQFLEQHTRARLLREVIKPVLARVAPIGEEALRQYYETHKDEFTLGEEIVASHVLLKSPDAAWAVLAELKAGADFAVLARERSEDAATKADGGRLSTIRRGQTTPEFEQAVFAMKRGEISGVVEDRAGFHVIKVDQGSPGSVKLFEAVKGWLQYQLTVRARQTATEQYVGELEKRATIEINRRALATIQVAGE